MTIVVSYVPGTEGDAALDAAVAESRLREQPLVVVNATRGDAAVDTHYASDSVVDELDRRLSESGVEHEIKRPMGPDIADLVLDEVEQAGAELLVVGLRRRSPVGKLVLGSVSQRLLLDSTVAVLAVRAPG